MKDFTQAELEASRSTVPADEQLDFCLARLYADRRHRVVQEVVHGLTFEELLGALLSARDELQAYHTWDERED